MDGWDAAEPAGLVVREGLDDFFAGVHDEGAHPGDRLVDGSTAEDEHVQVGAAGFEGDGGRVDGHGVARAEHRELAGPHRMPGVPTLPLPEKT